MLTFTGCDMCKMCQWIYSYSELIRHDGSSFCRCCFKTIEDERWAEGVLERVNRRNRLLLHYYVLELLLYF